MANCLSTRAGAAGALVLAALTSGGRPPPRSRPAAPSRPASSSPTSTWWARGTPTSSLAGTLGRVSDGTRTRDRLDHNQELYRLSYAHHGTLGM